MPRTIVANHNTAMDPFIIVWFMHGGKEKNKYESLSLSQTYIKKTVPAAKAELYNLPIVGTLMDAMGTIWIDRNSKDGRNRAKEELKKYIVDESLPPLMIFPQGTTTNTRTLSMFKTGAFMGQPVQPAALFYPNCLCDLSFLDGMGLVLVFLSFFLFFSTPFDTFLSFAAYGKDGYPIHQFCKN